jgi:hypothetical protein
MATESKTARLVHAQHGLDFDDEKQAAYEKLDDLADDYERAKDTYLDDRNDETRADYKDAARAYAAARTELKLAEEADPDHPRGAGEIAHATDEES